MDAGPRFDAYVWERGREPMLRFGPEDGPVVVLALPLFEEANRTRALGVGLLRALAPRGIGGVLPDLPGQGESETPLATVTLPDMQGAYEAAVTQAGAAYVGFGVGIRSGALLDTLGLIAGRWHLAPQTGAELVHELGRVRQAATGERLGERWWSDRDVTTIAGNSISCDLLTDLSLAEPFAEPAIPQRVVRLASDIRAADRKVDAAPLWRRAEPDSDPALIETLAADIADWIATCAA